MNAKQLLVGAHPFKANCYRILGFVHQDLGDQKRAIGYIEKALKIDKKVYGDRAPQVAIDLSDLGSARQIDGDPQKSQGYKSKRWQFSENPIFQYTLEPQFAC